jgi:hypothetical protein
MKYYLQSRSRNVLRNRFPKRTLLRPETGALRGLSHKRHGVVACVWREVQVQEPAILNEPVNALWTRVNCGNPPDENPDQHQM